jgi:ribosome maturation factor RimP
MRKIELSKVETLVKEVIESMEIRLYDMQFNEVSRTLKIFIEREQGGVTIKDCEKVSKSISEALDRSNLIDFQYTLEVSSPGIERYLTKPEHFQWARGKLAEIILKEKKIKGYIRDADEQSVTIAQSSGEVVIHLQEIITAKISEEFEYGKRR